jgi:uncharacterized protein YndB with AHSA1/START domain
MTTMTALTTQVYQVFIKATPERIWAAITKPEFTSQYFHGATVDTTPDGRRSYQDGELKNLAEVLEYDPPRRLVHGWISYYDPALAAEEPSRVTWEIEAEDSGYSLLTVTHDRLEGAPKTAESVSGAGWMMVLSGLKTLLETGEPLTTFS